jgi:hypothetical protein
VGSRLALSATVAVVCKGANLTENRYSLDDDGLRRRNMRSHRAVHPWPRRVLCRRKPYSALKRATSFSSIYGVVGACQPRLSRVLLTFRCHSCPSLPVRVRRREQTRSTVVFVAMTAEHCSLTVNHLPNARSGRYMEAVVYLTQAPAGADARRTLVPVVAVILSYCRIHYGCSGGWLSFCAWARFAHLGTCG